MRMTGLRRVVHCRPRGIAAEIRKLFSFPVSSILLCSWLAVVCGADDVDSKDPIRLVAPPTGQKILVRTVVKVDGHLKVKPPDGPAKSVSMNVAGNLEYEERVLHCDPSDRVRHDVRFYRRADAVLQVSGTKITQRLRPERRWIVADTSADEAVLYSTGGPLTREELELVDTQMSTTLLYRLLAPDEVASGATWSIDDSTLSLLFGLDAITESNVAATLTTISPSLATIKLKGEVHGAVRGVSSDLTIEGTLEYDWTARRFRSLELTVTEDRAIGHAEPGFRFTARFQTDLSELPTTSNLSDERIAGMPLQRTPASLALEFTPVSGGYQMFHNRDWHLTLDRPDVAILRLIRDGDLIAQCNISRLPNLPDGKIVTLEAFQGDVRTGLGERFGQFTEASEKRTSEGVRILRAVANGTQGDLPIQWVYYHFSNEHGQQAACVFTLDARLAPAFAGEDQALAGSLVFDRLGQEQAISSERSVGTRAASDRRDTAER